ncbi:hypothetical protein BC826DRAFT_1005999 [Russula brevipes]|nr:hypothetical protein BC826DRAFT_1005999 [Russula brevipes]
MRWTRSGYLNAAMMLSAPLTGASRETRPFMSSTMMGKGGQTSSVLLAGVLYVHRSCRFRRCVDANTTLRHRPQTCTSVCH